MASEGESCVQEAPLLHGASFDEIPPPGPQHAHAIPTDGAAPRGQGAGMYTPGAFTGSSGGPLRSRRDLKRASMQPWEGQERPTPEVGLARDQGGAYVYFMRYARGRKAFPVKMLTQEQASAEGWNECPVSLERFDSSEIDVLPGATFLPEHPKLCAGKLPCGHIIACLPLVMHMLVSDMRCPICRAGPCKRLYKKCLPKHLQQPLGRKVEAMRKEARDEQSRVDSALVQTMIQEGLYSPIGSGWFVQMQVTLTAYFYSSRSIFDSVPRGDVRSVYSVEFPLESSDLRRYSLSPQHVHQFVNNIRALNPTSFRLMAYTRTPDGESICLSSSQMFDVVDLWRGVGVQETDSMEGLFEVDGSGESQFVFRRLRSSARMSSVPPMPFHTITWSSSYHIMQHVASGG